MVACDIATRDEVAGLLATIGPGGPALTAVFHAAGTGAISRVADTTLTALAGRWPRRRAAPRTWTS